MWGIMEKKMETTGSIGLYRDYIGIVGPIGVILGNVLGLYRGNGK